MTKRNQNRQDAHLLLKANFKQLRLPTMLAEFEKLAQEAAEADQSYLDYLLRLTELEVAARTANALKARIKQAGFPVFKDLDTFDFSAAPGISKQKILELARGGWIDNKTNCCLVGASGTGKTHLAISLGLAACRDGRRVRFLTAAALVNRLEEAQKQFTLDRFLKQHRFVGKTVSIAFGVFTLYLRDRGVFQPAKQFDR